MKIIGMLKRALVMIYARNDVIVHPPTISPDFIIPHFLKKRNSSKKEEGFG
jgi:hypothetical protein